MLSHKPPQTRPAHLGLHADERYVAWRPDSDVYFRRHNELHELYGKWIEKNDENAGDIPRLLSLMYNIKQVMGEGVPGAFAELGVYRGNSASVLAHYASLSQRTLYLFDTFEGFSERNFSTHDIDMDAQKYYADTSMDEVKSIVGDGPVCIKGLFPQSIPNELDGVSFADNVRFAVVSLDCDLYEPTKAGIEWFYPRLSPGGIMFIHDFSSGYWEGTRWAAEEFLTTIPETVALLPDKSGTAILRKNRM